MGFRLAFAGLLLAFAGNAFATGCKSAQAADLKGDSGLLAVDIDAGIPISVVSIVRTGAVFGGPTLTGLQSRTNVCLFEMAAGEYRWSRVDLAYRSYLRVKDDARFRFKIVAGVVNYVGDFSIAPTPQGTYNLNVTNRAARMLVHLDRNFPGVRKKYSLTYQGAFPDRFLQFATAEIGAQSASEALDAGVASTLREPDKDAPAVLHDIVNELFARQQVNTVRLNPAGDLVAMTEYRGKKHHLSLLDAHSFTAIDIYRGDAGVRKVYFAGDRTLLFELSLSNGDNNYVVHIETKPGAAPAFTQFVIPGRGTFIDPVPQADAHTTYARIDNEGGVHMFRIALDGKRFDTHQFDITARLDKGVDKVFFGLVDGAGVLRLAHTVADGDYALMYRADAKSACHEVRRTTADEMFDPIMLSASGDSLVALTNHERAQIELGDMEAVSPDYQYRKLERPLLVIHGGADRRVPAEHALRLLLLGHEKKSPQLLSIISSASA